MSLDGRTATAAGRLALDLRRAEPRAGPPLARRIRRDRGRHRHRPRRRPAAHRPRRRALSASRPRRLRSAGPPAARLPAAPTASTESPVLVVARPRAPTAIAIARPARGRRRADRRRRRRRRSRPAALAELGRRDITSLFLEGGPTLAAAFAAAGEIDEARVFVAPILLGGGRAPLRGAGAHSIEDALRALALESEPSRRRRPDHGPLQGVVRCSPG